MNFTYEFVPLEADNLILQALKEKGAGHRFVQILATQNSDKTALDIIYSFMEKECLKNYKISSVHPGDSIPSITGQFLEAFVFENEIHDLFGVNITDIAIDFHGKFYAVKEQFPMDTVSKEAE